MAAKLAMQAPGAAAVGAMVGYTTADAKAVPQGPITLIVQELERLASRLYDLQERTCRIADTLTGPVPADCARDRIEPAGGSLTEMVGRTLQRCHALAGEINDHVQRTERAF